MLSCGDKDFQNRWKKVTFLSDIVNRMTFRLEVVSTNASLCNMYREHVHTCVFEHSKSVLFDNRDNIRVEESNPRDQNAVMVID